MRAPTTTTSTMRGVGTGRPRFASPSVVRRKEKRRTHRGRWSVTAVSSPLSSSSSSSSVKDGRNRHCNLLVANDADDGVIEAAEPRGGAAETRRSRKTNAGIERVGSFAALAGTTAVPGLIGTDFDLAGPGSVFTAVAVLAVIITVHECGHFFAARSQGIHVSQFSVGFGPNLFTYRGPEVEYSLKAVPLGGFVAFPDDDEDCPYPEDDPDLLRNRPVRDRAIVVSAGIIANVIFAFGILYNQVTTVGFNEQKFEPGVVVRAFTNGSVAREAGIEAGDIILSVDGEKLPAARKSVSKVVSMVKDSPNALMKFEIMHLGVDGAPEVKTVQVRPNGVGGEGKVGVKLESNSSINRHVAQNPFEAALLSTKEFARLSSMVWNSLTGLFTNFGESKSQVSGPIAIVATGAEVMRNDISGLYQFAAVININLAIVNILPLPALDGGFLLLIAIEALRGGKKLPVEVEQSITGAGVLFLFISGASLILRDTINLLPH